MTPEEKFNQTIWWALQELKKEYRATLEDEYVRFNYQTPSEKIPSHDDQRRALGVLQKEGAIKIIKNEFPRPFESLSKMIEVEPIRVLLDIPVKEQFEKVYKKYHKACDLNSYLNDYQQKVFKKKRELPKFSYVEHEEKIINGQETKQAIPSTTNRNLSLSEIADEEIVKFFEEEMQLLNKLLQICNEKTRWVLLIHPAHLADNDPDKAGFNRIGALKDLQNKYKVFRKFTPPLNSTHLPHVQIIKAWVNFQKLKNRAEDLHDEIESWKGNVIGIEQQKRELLQRLNSKFTQYPSQQTYTYSEKLLGAYTPANSFKPLGLSLLSPDKRRPDIRYNFMQAMRGLEKDGHFEIIDVDIDFFAKPQPTEESEKLVRWSLGTREYQFYPAEHCKVTLRVKRNTKYNQLVEEIRKPNKPSEKLITPSNLDTYKISVKDREIWVNNYLIGKPHAVGNNFEFFDYVRSQPPNTKIEWITIPDTPAWEMMKKAIQDRRFIKILNALGFKGEIRKAFFYKVGSSSLYYKGNEITKTDLEKAGVKIPLFLKELEVAHARIAPNSPI